MTERYYNIIGGERLSASSGTTYLDINPTHPLKTIGVFQRSGMEDVQRAIAAAVDAQRGWARMPAPSRGEILRRAGDILLARREQFGIALAEEVGKPLGEGEGYEVHASAGMAHYMAGEGRRLFGVTSPSEHEDKFACTVREPIGVVGMITPWNLPLLTPAWKIFPALICGNSVVLKPAEDAPRAAVMLMEVLEEAGVPPGVVNLVTGFGEQAGEPLCLDPRVKMIAFTGSTAVGRKIGAVAGGDLKKVTLELGGKNAIVVASDADIDLAAQGAVWGGYGTAGQRCTASSRVIVDRAVASRFLDAFQAKVAALRVGDPLDRATNVGPLINEKQLNRVHDYVGIGQREGARTVIGGEMLREAHAGGYFYAPTIFDKTDPNMRIAQEEIFGPVVTVLESSSFEQAIQIANATPYGLSLSLYTQDVSRAFRAARDFHSGIAYINAPTIGSEFHLPFGGTKNTGNGHREAGQAGVEQFSDTKTIFFDYSSQHRRSGVSAQMDEVEQ